jgi:hypothetical protein
MFAQDTRHRSGGAASAPGAAELAFSKLYEGLHQRIARAICHPCPVFSDGRTVRIEFLDCVAWVVNLSVHSIHVELRNPGGSWQRSRQKVDLSDPLEGLFWLDQLTLQWMPQIEEEFGDHASEAAWSLQYRLAGQFQDSDLLKPTSRQVRHHIRPSTKLIRIMGHISRRGARLPCDNQTYSDFWQDEESWNNLSDHYHHLAHFYYLLRKQGAIEKGANLSGMRAKCIERGLNPAGWRFLSEHGEMAYTALLQAGGDEPPELGKLLAYIEWQSRARLAKPLDTRFGNCLDEAGCIVKTGPGRYRIGIDPRLGCVAQERAARCPPGSDIWQEWEQRQAWVNVLDWVRDQQPTFDRNQWRKGWDAIYEAYQNWLQGKQPGLKWDAVLGTVVIKQWRLRELTNSTELEVESARMHHCAALYIDPCSDGEYVMFSAENARSGDPVATIGFEKTEKGWTLDQVRGKCNRDPSPEIRALGREIFRRMCG